MNTKIIPGYLGYQLTDDNQQIIGKNGRPLSLSGDPYKFANVYVNGKSGVLYLHRAVALVNVPGYFEGAYVDHIDNDPHNNEPSNLQWIRPRDNGYITKNSGSSEGLRYLICLYEERIAKLRTKLNSLEDVS